MEQTTKFCSNCQQFLPRTSFYIRKSGEIDSRCKECKKVLFAQWKKANPEKRKAQRAKEYQGLDRAIVNEKVAQLRAANPEAYKEINRRWYEGNRERTNLANRAGRKVRRAIQDGLLTKSDSCVRCGKTGCKIEASHDDYSKPLEVEWLCVPCHRKKDYKQPKT